MPMAAPVGFPLALSRGDRSELAQNSCQPIQNISLLPLSDDVVNVWLPACHYLEPVPMAERILGFVGM